MKHYICTGGCGGQSDSEGVCEAQFCKKEGHLLTACECADGEHEPVAVLDEDDAGFELKDDTDLVE